MIEGNDIDNLKFDDMSINDTDARKNKLNKSISRNEKFQLKTNAIPSDNHDEMQNKENVNNYLDQKIEQYRGYKSQLAHENQQSDQPFDDGSLNDIHRLG